MARSRVPFAVVHLLGVASCAQALPTPPDLTAFVASFEHPTGTVYGDADLAEVARTAEPMESYARDVEPVVRGAIGPLLARLEQSGVPTPGDPPALVLDGYAQVTRTCEGWDGSNAPDPTLDGTLTLRARVDANVINPVVWGDADHCRPVIEGVTVEATLAAYLEGGLGADVASAPLFMKVDGTVERGGAGFPVHVAARVEPGSVASLVPLADGTFVVVAVAVEGAVTVSGTNGTFRCSAFAGDCLFAWERIGPPDG